jgi:MFS transporter, Spinster family, sphingosine-1-phosphate transporter
MTTENLVTSLPLPRRPLARRRAPHPWTVLAVLTLVNAMAQSGGTVLAAVLPLVKADFGFTDGQLGLLTGYGSAVSFALLALPISHWASRRGSSLVLGLCMVVCGAANLLTAGCAAFWQLIATRLFAGVGPSAAWPLGQALVSDFFVPQRRAGALSVYTAGDFIGSTLPLVVGGWIGVHHGWRAAFAVFGVAVLAVALLQRWLVPDRSSAETAELDEGGVDDVPAVHWADGLRVLLRRRAFVHIMLGFSWASFAVSGLAKWMPSFYNRQFGLAPDQAAAFFGSAYAGGALLGLLLGGVLGNWIGSGRQDRLLPFCMITYLFTFPCILGVLFAPSLEFAFVAHVAATMFGAMPNGPVMSMIHATVPRSMRVLAASVFLLAMTLLGDGGGPLLIGVFSDVLQPRFGHESLKYAMLLVKLLGLLLFVHLTLAWIAARREAARATPAHPRSGDAR